MDSILLRGLGSRISGIAAAVRAEVNDAGGLAVLPRGCAVYLGGVEDWEEDGVAQVDILPVGPITGLMFCKAIFTGFLGVLRSVESGRCGEVSDCPEAFRRESLARKSALVW